MVPSVAPVPVKIANKSHAMDLDQFLLQVCDAYNTLEDPSIRYTQETTILPCVCHRLGKRSRFR